MTSPAQQSAPALLRGIDVSSWQNEIDWPAVASDGIEFAYVRASVGLRGDVRGDRNIGSTRLAGLRVGAYHYLEAGHDAEDQAQAFLKHFPLDVAALPGMLAPVLDLEEGGRDSADRALAWLRIVEEARGVRPMIYTSVGFADRVGLGRRVELAEYPLWCAHWTDRPDPIIPRPWDRWDVWQHANNGRVRGISGPVDLDVARRTT